MFQVAALLLAIALAACSNGSPGDGVAGTTAGASASGGDGGGGTGGAAGDAGAGSVAGSGGSAGMSGGAGGDSFDAGGDGDGDGDGDAGQGGASGMQGGSGATGGRSGSGGMGGTGGTADPCASVDCDDGNDCTIDTCRLLSGTGTCRHANEHRSGIDCSDGFFDGQCLATEGVCNVQCGNTDQLCCEDECRPGLDCRPVVPDAPPAFITERCVEDTPCGGEGEPCCLELEGTALTTVCDGDMVCGAPAGGGSGSECNAE